MSSERDNALFRALVEGEIAESSAEIREMFARDPDLEREWREMKELFSALDASKRARKEVLAQALNVKDAPGEEQVERALRRAMSGATPGTAAASDVGSGIARDDSAGKILSRPSVKERVRPAGSTRALIWIAAAAVVLVCTIIALRRKDSPTNGRDGMLLGNLDLEVRASIDPVSGEARFEWHGATTPGAQYVLTVQGKAAEAQEWKDVMPPLTLSTNGWSAKKSTVASWPPMLRWRVTTIDGEIQSAWAYLSLPH